MGLLLAAPGSALDVPPRPEGRLNDYAGLLSPADRQRIETRLQGIEEANSNQFVVAVFRSLEGDSLESFSIRLAEAWQIGQAGRDNGLLLVLFTEDRKVRIEVGYGLEGAITDALSGRIIRDVLAPPFRRGEYAAGILAAVAALDQASRGEFEPLPPARRGTPSPADSFPFVLVFLVIAGVLSALRRAVFLGGRGTRRRGGLWWMGPGGGFGGGGGGFGGGGFSGGGGGFGGGGASGGW